MAYFRLLIALWRFAPQRWKVVFCLVTHILGYASMLVNPFVFGKIVGTLAGNQDQILGSLTKWLLAWFGLWIWFQICHRLAQSLLYNVAFRSKQNFLNQSYEQVTRLPLSWHTNHHSGETISRINKGGEAIANFTVFHFRYTESFTLFWGPILALGFLSWKISLITFVIVMLSIAVMWQFDRKLVHKYREINEIDHKISATVFDFISNIRTIITLRLGSKTRKEFDKQIERGYKPFMTGEVTYNQSKWFLISAGVLILEIVVLYFYIWDELRNGVVNTAVLAASVTTIFLLLQQISRSYMSIASDYQQIIAWHTDFESSENIRFAEVARPSQIDHVHDWETIEISHLHFGYETDTPVLEDIHLTLQHGQKIALVGESGSGKSTFLAVLRGLYMPSTVQLNVDGDMSSDLLPLSTTTTLIPQEPEIFENTIKFNLTVGIDYTDQQVDTAIKLAQFEPILKALAKGLQSDVREKGVTLSGGEKQRLALARGILAASNSSIILMDEPTSSVDTHNEHQIYNKVFDHFSQATIISSIHRLHLLDKFDQIIVMDQGKIVQSGTFDNLQASPGLLQDLLKKYALGGERIGEPTQQ